MTINVDAPIADDSAAASWREQPAFFPGEDGSTLLGVFTPATSESLGVGAVVLSGGGFIGSTNRNRLNIRICSELATAGFHTMRFDWHGIGDSTGSVDRFDLDRPFVQDVVGAAKWVADQGINRSVLIGSCFGARTALAAASSIEGLDALLLISLPLRTRRRSVPRRDPGQRMAEERSLLDVLRQGLRPSMFSALRHPQRRRTAWRFAKAKTRSLIRTGRNTGQASDALQGIGVDNLSWVSPDVVSSLTDLVSKHIPVHLIYGAEDHDYAEFLAARSGSFGGLLSGEGIHVEVLPGEVHGFQRVEAQEAVLGSVGLWAAATATTSSRSDVE